MSAAVTGQEAIGRRPGEPSPGAAPTISVIVPFHGACLHLRTCIESLLDQTVPPSSYELLFVDNGSSEGAAGVVAGYAGIRLFHESRRGAYFARNRALAEARGEIIAFTDADCRVEPDWLEQIKAGMRPPEVGILLGRRAAGAGGVMRLIADYEARKTAYVLGGGTREIVFGHTNCMAARRRVIDGVGPFPEVERGGDTVLVRRAVDRYGLSVARYRPEMRVTHLELDSLRAFYRKSRTYGRSNERLRDRVEFRPLRLRERWRVFRETARAQPRSVVSGAVLLPCLAGGLVCYESSRRVTSLSRRVGPAVSGWWGLARARNWWRSKLPFAFAAALLLAPHPPAARLLVLLGAVAASACFGFGLNEIADRRSDARSGRTNAASSLSRAGRGAFLAVTGGAAVGLSAATATGVVAPLVIGAGLGLSAAYSVPPIRLKARGLAGVFAAAAAQWTAPVLAVATLGADGWTTPAAGTLALLGLAVGMRSMLLHQLKDALKDRVGGVRTFVARGGAAHPLIALAFAVETLLLAAVLVLARPGSAAAALALGAWVVLGSLRRSPLASLRRRLAGPGAPPLSEYYVTVLPIAMLLSWLALPPTTWSRALLATAGGLVALSRRRPRAADPPTAVADPPFDHPVAAALSFLESSQGPDGGFTTLVGRDPALADGEAVRAVFETAFVVRVLQRWTDDLAAATIVRRAQAFLRAERESSGLWRYYGRGSLIQADVDTTATAMLALGPAESDAAAIEAIRGNFEPDGAIETWLLDPTSGPPHEDCVDRCAVANVYLMLRRRSIDAPETRLYLEETLVSRRYRAGTPYYPSPFFFLYAMAGLAGDLDPEVVRRIEPEIVALLDERGPTSHLEAALACAALVACGAEDGRVRALRDAILAEQLADGSWPPAALCGGPSRRIWYGSRELTTALCLEAVRSS